jgi:hypothetical protein
MLKVILVTSRILQQVTLSLRMTSNRSKHVVLYNKYNLVVFGWIST